MPIKEFKKIDDFLNFARTIDTFADCQDIYELLSINKSDSYPDIEVKIKAFVNEYRGLGPRKFRDFGRMVPTVAETIQRVLRDHKDEYNEYLEENRPKIKKLHEYFSAFTKRDKILDSKEKSDLVEEGKEQGLSESQVLNLVDKWMIRYDVTEAEHSPSVSAIPYDVLLSKTYYEILGVPEDADYSQIKDAYNTEYQKYNISRDKKRAIAKWVQVSEAWDFLKNPAKRREYDEEQRRKRDKGLTREGDPNIEIVDESGKERRSFEFTNMRLGSTLSVTVTAKNGGGGTLDAKIKTNRPWLIVDADRIHQSKLPQRIAITVDPRKLKRENKLGGRDKGIIEITYQRGSYIESKQIAVEFSIEVPADALKRFRKGFIPATVLIGAAIGYLTGGILGEVGLLILIIALIPGSIHLGIKDGVDVWVSGCKTFIGGAILLLILLYLVDTFPRASSVSFGVLFFPMIGLGLSKTLFPYRKTMIPFIWTTALVIVLAAAVSGFVLAKKERESQLAKSQAAQRAIQADSNKLPGEWHGKLDRNETRLFITRANKQLSGKMIYGGIEEKLSVNLKNNDGKIVIVLKGTNYKRLKGKGRFYLDTFYGTLSGDGRSIKGEYIDTAKRKGKWSVLKLSPRMPTLKL